MNEYIYQNNIKQEFLKVYHSEVKRKSKEYEIFHTDDTRVEYLHQYIDKTRRIIITFDFNKHIFAKTKVYERVNIVETINKSKLIIF